MLCCTIKMTEAIVIQKQAFATTHSLLFSASWSSRSTIIVSSVSGLGRPWWNKASKDNPWAFIPIWSPSDMVWCLEVTQITWWKYLSSTTTTKISFILLNKLSSIVMVPHNFLCLCIYNRLITFTAVVVPILETQVPFLGGLTYSMVHGYFSTYTYMWQ